MSHSHLAIRHLVRKLESVERARNKMSPPSWLVGLIDRMSDLFEPFSGVARVGYECQKTDAGWEVALFLGEHELIGGPEDGELRAINFRFNLLPVQQLFDSLHVLSWNVFPSSHVCFDDVADLSLLTIEGRVEGELVRVQVHAGPPAGVGPAMREHADGRMELV